MLQSQRLRNQYAAFGIAHLAVLCITASVLPYVTPIIASSRALRHSCVSISYKEDCLISSGCKWCRINLRGPSFGCFDAKHVENLPAGSIARCEHEVSAPDSVYQQSNPADNEDPQLDEVVGELERVAFADVLSNHINEASLDTKGATTSDSTPGFEYDDVWGAEQFADEWLVSGLVPETEEDSTFFENFDAEEFMPDTVPETTDTSTQEDELYSAATAVTDAEIDAAIDSIAQHSMAQEDKPSLAEHVTDAITEAMDSLKWEESSSSAAAGTATQTRDKAVDSSSSAAHVTEAITDAITKAMDALRWEEESASAHTVSTTEIRDRPQQEEEMMGSSQQEEESSFSAIVASWGALGKSSDDMVDQWAKGVLQAGNDAKMRDAKVAEEDVESIMSERVRHVESLIRQEEAEGESSMM